MAIVTKEILKGFFKSGSRPTAGNFSDLIDSMYNKLDDDISSTVIESTDPGKPIPAVFAKIENNESTGMGFNEVKTKNTVLQLIPGGNIGVGTSVPLYKLHVAGTVAAPARVGTYTDKNVNPDTVLANGEWQTILAGLDGLNAFEIIASVSGAKGSGRYGLLHATVLSAFGNSRSSIVQNSARYSGFFRPFKLRWTGQVHNYNLQIRTRRDYGMGVKINYNITQLICE